MHVDARTALAIAREQRGKEAHRRFRGEAERNAARQFAAQLARWGVTRVCPLGQMQSPPLTWRHDGRPALSDLVTWTDFES